MIPPRPRNTSSSTRLVTNSDGSNRSETKDIATAHFTALGGAEVARVIGGPKAAAGCALAAGSIGSTAQYADNHGQCVGLSYWGVYPAVGWNPFAYTGPQCQ